MASKYFNHKISCFAFNLFFINLIFFTQKFMFWIYFICQPLFVYDKLDKKGVFFMKKNITALIFGILFAIALGFGAFLYLNLGFAMALAGSGYVAYFMYVFAVLAVATIVFSAFAIKKVKVTKIGFTTTLSIAFLCEAYTIWQLLALSSADKFDILGALPFLLLLSLPLVFGVIATVFAYLGKKKEKNAPAVGNSLKQPEAQEETFIICEHCGATQSKDKERCSSCGAYLRK